MTQGFPVGIARRLRKALDRPPGPFSEPNLPIPVAKVIQASLGSTEQTLDDPEPDQVRTLEPIGTWPYPADTQSELVAVLQRVLAKLEAAVTK